MGCLSFHPRKIVTTGEGGAVTTDDDALAGAIRSMRHHGWDADDMPAPGVNYRLSDVLCALGIPQLRRLDELLRAKGLRDGPSREEVAVAAYFLWEQEGRPPGRDREHWQWADGAWRAA